MARVATVGRDGRIAAPVDESSPVGRLCLIWRLLRRAAADGFISGVVLGPPGEPDHVDPSHLDILELLVREDGRRMSDLAIGLRVDPSTITRAMHRMEQAGLATRRPVAADGRVVTAHITAEGRRIHELVDQRRTELIEAAFTDFTPEEQVQLADLIERFFGSLAGRAAATGPSSTAAG